MLGTRIAELRKEKKVSQEQLAEILNTSRQAVSKWERGDAYPDIDRLKDLAIYFNVSIDYLLDYDIESSSVSCFIEKLKSANENKTYHITIEEVKSILVKNSNNFDLLIACTNYLFQLWNYNRDYQIIDLLLNYCKKGIAIYKNNNMFNVSMANLKESLAILYIIKKDYASAKSCLKDAEFNDKDNTLAGCEIELGNYDSASTILSNTFIHSLSSLIMTNLYQLRLYLRTNKIKEAYDLALWSESLIKSVSKDEKSIIDLLYIVIAIKACTEKYLKYDNTASISFLKEQYNSIIKKDNMVDVELKYYHQRMNYYFIDNSIEEILFEETKACEGCQIYGDMQEVFNKIFKEK